MRGDKAVAEGVAQNELKGKTLACRSTAQQHGNEGKAAGAANRLPRYMERRRSSTSVNLSLGCPQNTDVHRDIQ